MVKKILPFLCSLAPLYAFGAEVVIGSNPDEISLGVGEYANVLSDDNINLNVGTGGISIANLSVLTATQAPATTNGDLYIVNTASLPFGIVSNGDIAISNNIRVSDATAGLQISGPVAMSVDGNIVADGLFDVSGVTNFTAGSISSGSDLSISAGRITTGLISSSDGDTSIIADRALLISGIVASKNPDSTNTPTTTLGGATVKIGNVQNLSGDMTITSDGYFTSGGNVENSGTSLTISADGAMSVSGTLKNDLVSGTLNITADSLTVSGSDAVNNSSFVNTGNAVFNIDGDMLLAHGMNLDNMAAASGLWINAGTLDLGTDNIISNERSYVNIDVVGGVLNVGTIANGVEGGSGNASAIMALKGVGVQVASVQNYGNNLTIDTYDSTATNNVTVSGGITTASGSVTNITAADTLGINGDIINSGNTTLTGSVVNLAGVSNSGAGSTLNISAPTNNGVMRINGALSNTGGTTTVVSKDLALGVVTNNSGVLNVTASDTDGDALSISSIAVNGGVMNLNAWLGGVDAGTLNVALNGVLNLGSAVHNVATTGAVVVAGNVNLADAASSGNGDLYLTSNDTGIVSGANITIGGNIIATWDTARAATFDGVNIYVNGNNGINVQGEGNIVTLGSNSTSSELTVTNALNAENNGNIEIYSGNSSAKSLNETNNGAFLMHGNSFTATSGTINVADGVWFDDSTTAPVVGMIIDGTLSAFDLNSSASNITVNNGINIGNGKSLSVSAGDSAIISGTTTINGQLNVNAANNATFNSGIITAGTASPSLSVSAKTININGITNAGTTSLSAISGAGTIGANATISNSGTFIATANNNINLAGFESTDGSVTITSNNANVEAGGFSVSGGTALITGSGIVFDSMELATSTTTLVASTIGVDGDVSVGGNIIQGASSADVVSSVGVLKLVGASTEFSANKLIITNGGFVAKSGVAEYTIDDVADLGASIKVLEDASSTITADTIESGDVTNSGILNLETNNLVSGLTLGNVINNSELSIKTNGSLNAVSFANNADAITTITSTDMTLSGSMAASGVLYQGASSLGSVNIKNNNYSITASNIVLGGISQSNSYNMVMNTSDLTVNGNISAYDLTIAANPAGNWSNVYIDGNVSGGVKFYGLEHMTVDGNYIYNQGSILHAAVLPYAEEVSMNTTIYDYWADVSLVDDSTLGQITNHNNNPENALIYINGAFTSNLSSAGSVLEGAPLIAPEMGINLYNVVDQGTAIWLLYAKEGVSDLATKIRNLNINFCNSDASICFNYFDAFDTSVNSITNSDNRGTENNLPIYLSVRDYNNDGLNDSLYIVFDPRFGGPVKVFSIEPIVRRVDDSTNGEAEAANGLDKMVAGQLNNKGFYYDTPIEAIPLVFNGTNLSELATELYNRMEQYVINRDGTSLARLSRLVQPRELEQVAASIALNEHTSFRDFEDHMFDEFIWNRNRNLSKAWFDADLGMFRLDASDSKVLTGNRFSVTAGFDWQNSSRMVAGLMARISHMSSDNADNMDLSYMPDQTIYGHNHMRVADTDIGIGGYLLYTLGTKARVYGNAMLDAHVFDLSREQNYVNSIKGAGTAFSLISEFGLLHDLLNQYVVGNLYTRLGYNFGFSIKEKSAGAEYMHLKSDGYLIFTPGYSLIAQKRIYTSPWFQIRPYASIGIEYDVLGMPDSVNYKFGPARSYSNYNIAVDPLWVNIGGGIEMLSANGMQLGLDYRYQYNHDIQLHNIRLSGSIRF